MNIGLSFSPDLLRSRDIVVIAQCDLGEIQGFLIVPGFIAMAGQQEPEIDKRRRDPLGKLARNG